MKCAESIVVVTGGGQGLGESIARAAKERGAAGVVVADLSAEHAEAVAGAVDGLAVQADLATEAGVRAVVDAAGERYGRVDIWIANAGIGRHSDPFSDDKIYDDMWRLHVLSQVWAARALIPHWLARGRGHFVAVSSANALTSNPVSLAYTVTKHAELAAVEWLGMTYGRRGVTTTTFCPKGMLTPLLLASADDNEYVKQSALPGAVSPEEAARLCLDAVEADQSLAHTSLPVLDLARLRLDHHDEFLSGLQDLHDLVPQIGTPPDPA